MYTYQTILLNRVFKTNEFNMIKPRVQSKADRVIYTIPLDLEKKSLKMGGALQKLNEASDDWAELADVLEFFDF